MARPIEWMGNGRPLPTSQFPPTHPFARQPEEEEYFDDSREIGGLADLPVLSSPPSYATTDPHPSQLQHIEKGKQRASGAQVHSAYEIHHAAPKPGLLIVRAGSEEPLYYIGRYSAVNTPDLIVYAGTDSRGPQVAQIKLTTTRDLQFFIGSNDTAADDDWKVVKFVSEGRIFSSDSYHFSIASADGTATRSLAWKQTHDTHLGSGRFRSKDFKLVDEACEASGASGALAVFLDATASNDGTVGRLEFHQALGSKEGDLAALLVIMALRERTRRHVRVTGIVNKSQQWPDRHGI